MIVYLYLGFHTKEKLSLDQIAKFMGTSREPVRKRLNKAIEKLQKNPNVKKYFEDYL
jgi:DNA-directed RNA polymerase sigma subunit (sigma70/sigma32)